VAVVLVDTSIWIEAQSGRFDLARHVGYDSVAICPPIAQELLQGASGARRYELAWRAILDSRMLDDPMPLATFEDAAHIYRMCLSGGHEILSPYDCLIASCAIRNNVPLLQRDRDFEKIAEVAPLDLMPNR
jgi:predicted nucleic acid-binding protein